MNANVGRHPLVSAPVIGTPVALPSTPVLLVVWLIAALIACFFALVLRDSALIDDMYIPRTNDSFYHARRILDALGERGFYQFDERLHVPDGAWISWPWAYDYLLAKAAALAMWLKPGLDPMAFISYVPVAWIFVNAALFLAATGAIGLSFGMRLLAMFCFAFSPLTQMLHSIGMIDHHYVEFTFVLLAIWLGLRWFKDTASVRKAVALGIALGIAPAFHNGLFILQLLPLGCLFILWLRGNAPPLRAARGFALALFVATQLSVLPSEPYRAFMFEFGLLSWFHVYVALCTAIVVVFMSWRPRTSAQLAAVFGISAALMAPLVAQVVSGAGFLSAEFSILGDIVEARSPYRLFVDTFGPLNTLSYYSHLLFTAPLLLGFYGYRVLRETAPEKLYYAVLAVFGMAMLLAQIRLHYFGSFALMTGSLLLVDTWQRRFRWHRGAVFAMTFAVLVAAYQPALRHRLMLVYAPGGDAEYASAFAAFLDLRELCEREPGVVLAANNDGSPILFHTDCSVVANNFILRPEDARKIDEIGRLMRLSPAELRRTRPDIKYVLLRARDFGVAEDGSAAPDANNPLARQLLLDEAPPAGFSLIKTILVNKAADGPTNVHARLYAIAPLAAEGG